MNLPKGKSFSGKQWIFPQCDEREVLAIQQQCGVSDVIARILSARHIPTSQVHEFLQPRLKDLLPDPSLLLGMDNGVERVVCAIENIKTNGFPINSNHSREKITIYGDYDVDGATSVSLLMRYFEQIGIHADFYIPDRLTEGYGVHIDSISKIKQQGTTLLIMVDCGTTSSKEIELATTLGMDSIVLDHHAANVELPKAVAVVNPHRIDQPCVSHTQDLCAAGVVFLFLVALQRRLKELKYFDANGFSAPPNLLEYCDLVALGTVCDVMPLLGLNRAFVCHGLKLMRNNEGIRALMDVAGIKDKLCAGHLGFAIGPRINAGGRIGSSALGTQLLTTHDELVAKEIALKLNALNEERQRMENKMLREAIDEIEQRELTKNPSLLIGHKSWHAGLIGILASRLKDRYNRPSFVVSIEGDTCRGSARSIVGLNIGELIHKAVRLGILTGGGGHSMAGGLSLQLQKFETFYEFLNVETAEFVKSYVPTLQIDAEIFCPTIELLHDLEQLEPFGVGNHAPKLCIRRVNPIFTKVVSGGHLQCCFRNEAGDSLRAIAFRAAGTNLEQALRNGQAMSIAVTIKEDSFNPGAVQLILEDATAL
ncbi:MAG: single-stranded-DNA-specific exonuclease RecJ [Holosporales bacterium]|jgi:single-stranded-DNA-specific exonuclease|nr:single-stranded-DNA-specific exonuclease RecJ [Holosporales bacterium]